MTEIDIRDILQAWLRVVWVSDEEDLYELDFDNKDKLAKLVFECAYTKWSFAEWVNLEEEVAMIMQS